MNPKVDNYILGGCGRCPLGGTPSCKVHKWTGELSYLRSVIQESGLKEEVKWGVPCYTFENKNILILAAFKEYAAISFFKGSLLKDEEGILQKPGKNTQAARIIKFTDINEILKLENLVSAYIKEAVYLEQAKKEPESKKVSEYPLPDEFRKRLEDDPLLKTAFNTLTPGRQKAYLLHFSDAKQSKTRESRIEKCLPLILAGRGLYD